MFKKIINLFRSTTEQEIKVHGSDDVNVVFNVDNFNKWFCDPNNNAVYANKGIFLRLDKLSNAHIEDYILKRFNLKIYDSVAEKVIHQFKNDIEEDWKNKMVEISKKIHNKHK